jgi:hypothetical protein
MAKSKSPVRRTRAKSAGAKTRARRSARAKTSLAPQAGAKLKNVAKKAALAAGIAAVGTALSELNPKQKEPAKQMSQRTPAKR